MSHTKSRIISKLIRILCACGVLAAAFGASNDLVVVSMIFLNQHARDAASRNNVDRTAVEKRAKRLRVTEAELSVIDRAALGYPSADQNIHRQAMEYRKQCAIAGVPLDSKVVHSFTEQRAAAAQTAFADIQSHISATDYLGLQQYLRTDFSRMLRPQAVKQ
jgi:hypothetical protein